MNAKALVAIILAIASVTGILAVAEIQDAEAADISWVDLGSESIGYGFTPAEGTDYESFDAKFIALNSEQTYVGERGYTATWTIKDHGSNSVENDSTDSVPTWVFTYTPSADETSPVTLTSSESNKQDSDLSISMTRDDVGKYVITVGIADGKTVTDVLGTHNLEITVQFSLKLGDNDDDRLDLNIVHYKAALEVYDNRLDGMTVNDFFVNTNSTGNYIKFENDSDDNDGLNITSDRFNRYVWYATGLPDGLKIEAGVISGMPVESTKVGNVSTPAKVTIVVRGTQTNPTNVSETDGREYYGTLEINVWESVADSYDFVLTEGTSDDASEKKLFGSGNDYVAVNGADVNLEITGTQKFDGQVTVIDADSGLRATVSGAESTADDSKIVMTYDIPLSGVGTYVIMIQGEDVDESITLRVVAQTAGSSGVGFVVIGS